MGLGNPGLNQVIIYFSNLLKATVRNFDTLKLEFVK